MDKETLQKRKRLKEFGEHLEAQIYRKFKSKDAFLRETGIFKATLHDILTGKVDPQLTTLWRIADGLEVSIRDLFPDK
jgi:transcriptional regulator with XRE-family HTH domain